MPGRMISTVSTALQVGLIASRHPSSAHAVSRRLWQRVLQSSQVQQATGQPRLRGPQRLSQLGQPRLRSDLTESTRLVSASASVYSVQAVHSTLLLKVCVREPLRICSSVRFLLPVQGSMTSPHTALHSTRRLETGLLRLRSLLCSALTRPARGAIIVEIVHVSTFLEITRFHSFTLLNTLRTAVYGLFTARISGAIIVRVFRNPKHFMPEINAIEPF